MGKLLSIFVEILKENSPTLIRGIFFLFLLPSPLPPPPSPHKAPNVSGVTNAYHEKVPRCERSHKTMIIKEIVI